MSFVIVNVNDIFAFYYGDIFFHSRLLAVLCKALATMGCGAYWWLVMTRMLREVVVRKILLSITVIVK